MGGWVECAGQGRGCLKPIHRSFHGASWCRACPVRTNAAVVQLLRALAAVQAKDGGCRGVALAYAREYPWMDVTIWAVFEWWTAI